MRGQTTADEIRTYEGLPRNLFRQSSGCLGGRDTNTATSVVLIRQIWSVVYLCSVAPGSDTAIERGGVCRTAAESEI